MDRPTGVRSALLVLFAALCGCASAPRPAGARPVGAQPAVTPPAGAAPAAPIRSGAAAAPAVRPPSPESVSQKEPGGDAEDPHQAALLRQLAIPWGRRNDKGDQIHVPTPDWEHWKRVRYWGFEHLAGWRYGDKHHVVAVAVVHDVPTGEPNDSEACLRRFEAWARPQVKGFEIQLGSRGSREDRWREHTIVIEWADGWVAMGFERKEFSAAWAAYPAYPDACLIYAMAVPWRGHRELAQKVRDRWVDEGFRRMIPRTKHRPVPQ
jgi:hypothetical protein